MSLKFSWIFLLLIFQLTSARIEYVCSRCKCRFTDTGSSQYLDVYCDASTDSKTNFELTHFKEAPKVKNLYVFNYHKVRLSLPRLGGDLSSDYDQGAAAKVEIRNAITLKVDRWVEGANHTIVNVHRMTFADDISIRDRVAIASMVLINSTIPQVNSGALSFTAVGRKFVAKNISIGKIDTGGIVFPMDSNNSIFLLNSTKILGPVAEGGVDIKATVVIVSSSKFGSGVASKFRFTGTKKILISNTTVIQSKPAEFIDIYSPVIILINNTFI